MGIKRDILVKGHYSAIEQYSEPAESSLRSETIFFKKIRFNIILFSMPLSTGWHFLRYNPVAEFATYFMLVSFLTYYLA
jgi:hypothetical protein